MSVPEPLRHEGKLDVHIKALNLAVHTSKILGNKNIFNPEINARLIDRLDRCAQDIYVKSWQANKINAETNFINRNMRYTLQEEAILLCDEMHTLIGIAKHVYHLRDRKVTYWSNLVTKVRTLLQGWKESDVKRYGQPQV